MYTVYEYCYSIYNLETLILSVEFERMKRGEPPKRKEVKTIDRRQSQDIVGNMFDKMTKIRGAMEGYDEEDDEDEDVEWSGDDDSDDDSMY